MTTFCRLFFPERVGIRVISVDQPASFLQLQHQGSLGRRLSKGRGLKMGLLHPEQQSIDKGFLGAGFLPFLLLGLHFGLLHYC